MYSDIAWSPPPHYLEPLLDQSQTPLFIIIAVTILLEYDIVYNYDLICILSILCHQIMNISSQLVTTHLIL